MLYPACSATLQSSALLCLLCNIPELCYDLSALQHYRALLYSVSSATSQSSALLCLLYNITELCSAPPTLQHPRALLCSICFAYFETSQSSTLLCLLCNILELCSVCSTPSTLCSDNHIHCYECFLSQIAKHTFQSIHYCSLIIPTCCSEIYFHCSECSQFAR